LGQGGVSRNAATPFTVALSPGHSYITNFRSLSQNATGNHLDRAEKVPNIAQTSGNFEFFVPRSDMP